MCGALVLTVLSHGTSVRTGAAAHKLRVDSLATTAAVAAFWKERDGMDAFLAFPRQRFADQVRTREVSFQEALDLSNPRSPEERALDRKSTRLNSSHH